MTEEKNKLKRHWVEEAVSRALRCQWEDAITANESILSLFPDDADAYNRLGKAYTELGRYAEARAAYNRTLQIDHFNTIAKKNLQRLSPLNAALPAKPPVTPAAPENAALPHLFIETMGKTGTTTLVSIAGQETLARVTAGAPIQLEIQGNTLVANSQRGDRLGEVEPRLGQRLVNFIKAGNRYAAAITSLDNHLVRILIRETHQDPSQAGRVSFPPKRGTDNGFRAYTKEAVLKYDEEEDRYHDDVDNGVETESAEEGPEENEPFEENDADEE